MADEVKVYEVKFNDYGVVHVVAKSYGDATYAYEEWVRTNYRPDESWQTKSIVELPSTNPVILST